MLSRQFLYTVFILTFFITFASPAHSQRASRGIQGQQAPGWGVDDWFNLPAGRESLDITDYRGKVLYLYCFQSWCPGCLKYGFPTLREMVDRFVRNDSVAFVAIQTVFEGYSANTVDRARDLAKQYSLEIPFGQSGQRGARSLLMSRYRTGGTPWTIIIDPDGVVRYNDFHIQPDDATAIINNLLAERPAETDDLEQEQ